METQAVVAGVVDTNAREARPDVIESGEFAFVRPFQGFGGVAYGHPGGSFPILFPDLWKDSSMAQVREALSANEAASVTGVPLKQVHRIVDAGLLEGAVESRAGIRVIVGRGLVGLKLAHETANLPTPEGRRRVIKQLLRRPDAKRVEANAVTFNVRPMEAAIRRGLSTLGKAKKMVAIDSDVLGGTPCFKGTRIPVHDIATMIANGDQKSAILKAYPQLTAEQIDLALLYADAYPRRGRPRRNPLWRKAEQISSQRLSLRDLPG
jgi:uncharacterized protein (DUF433 family)